MRHKVGQWNVICDRCGGKFKNVQCKFEWNNLLVCKGCWEPRQPQDFVRGIPDDQSVPYTRSEPEDKFIGTLTADEIGD